MSILPSRRMVFSAGAALAALPASAALAAALPTVLVEQTYLKAAPQKRASLVEYIKLNWFVMDARGRDAGIFTSFALFEEIDENTDWDLVMAVGYPQAQGYEEPATKAVFDGIRKSHVEVLVDGLGLKGLGTIVRHHRLRLTASG